MTFAFNKINADWARTIIEDYDDDRDPSAVLVLLKRVQQQEGWISREAIDYIAQELSLSAGAIFDLLVSRSDFKLTLPVTSSSPPGRALVHIKSCLPKLATMGLQERDEARADGVSSFYIDPAIGDYLIEEKPDGVKILTPLAFDAKGKVPAV